MHRAPSPPRWLSRAPQSIDAYRTQFSEPESLAKSLVIELEGEVIGFDSFEAFANAPAESVRGKIVFVSHAMAKAQDGSGYGPFGLARSRGPTLASQRGALAIVVRSIGTDYHRNPHTGVMSFAEGVAPIPAGAVSLPDQDWVKAGEVVLSTDTTHPAGERVAAPETIPGYEESRAAVSPRLASASCTASRAISTLRSVASRWFSVRASVAGSTSGSAQVTVSAVPASFGTSATLTSVTGGGAADADLLVHDPAQDTVVVADRLAPRALLDPGQHVQAAAVGQPHVGDDGVELLGLQLVPGLGQRQQRLARCLVLRL